MYCCLFGSSEGFLLVAQNDVFWLVILKSFYVHSKIIKELIWMFCQSIKQLVKLPIEVSGSNCRMDSKLFVPLFIFFDV